MTAEIMEMAKKLLEKEIPEELLQIYAKDVEAYICAYCGVSQIPAGCETLAARMLAAAAEGQEGGQVKSLSRGDYSVSFTDGDREGLSQFDQRLNAFRRVKWGGTV